MNTIEKNLPKLTFYEPNKRYYTLPDFECFDVSQENNPEPCSGQECIFYFDDQYHIGFPLDTMLKPRKWIWKDKCCDRRLHMDDYNKPSEIIHLWYPLPKEPPIEIEQE